MLQFITHPSSRFSIQEEVQMALEGGCRWIQLRMKDFPIEEIREVAMEIMPMCQENEAFFVLDDHVELTNDLKIHGVHLGKHDMPATEARELLGPEAVIGVTANTAADIISYRKIDVDYVGLGPFRYTTTKANLSPIIGVEGYKRIVDEVRAAEVTLPIVAIGGITIEDLPAIMATGVNGVAMSGAIINADDPVEYTSRVIQLLNDITK